jgi:hypothetical protein
MAGAWYAASSVLDAEVLWQRSRRWTWSSTPPGNWRDDRAAGNAGGGDAAGADAASAGDSPCAVDDRIRQCSRRPPLTASVRAERRSRHHRVDRRACGDRCSVRAGESRARLRLSVGRRDTSTRRSRRARSIWTGWPLPSPVCRPATAGRQGPARSSAAELATLRQQLVRLLLRGSLPSMAAVPAVLAEMQIGEPQDLAMLSAGLAEIRRLVG